MEVRRWTFNLIILSIMVLIVSLFTTIDFSHEDEDIASYCARTFNTYGKCPFDKCVGDCERDPTYGVAECRPVCVPKPCTMFTLEYCPLDMCKVVRDCEGDIVCDYKESKTDSAEC